MDGIVFAAQLGTPLYPSKTARRPLMFLPAGCRLVVVAEEDDVLLVETEVRQRGYVRRSEVE